MRDVSCDDAEQPIDPRSTARVSQPAFREMLQAEMTPRLPMQRRHLTSQCERKAPERREIVMKLIQQLYHAHQSRIDR